MQRYRGNNYPIVVVLKMNGVAVDLTGDTVVFNYGETGRVRQIVGVITDAINGVVTFTPTAEDFQISGIFQYDIKRTTQSGVVFTHVAMLDLHTKDTLEIIRGVE